MATEPIIRECKKDGWVIKKFTMAVSGKDIVVSDSRKAFKEMCDECVAFVKAHLALQHNSGSKQPPHPAENPRDKKGKGKKPKEYAEPRK